MQGIEHLKSFGEGLLRTADLSDSILSDGKVGLEDIGQLMRVPAIIPLLKEVNGVGQEIIDLTAEEATDLKAHYSQVIIKLRGNVDPGKVAQIAEKVVTAVILLAEAVSVFTAK